MEQLSPQVMHKLVFTVLVHGLPDAQTGIALDVLLEAQQHANSQVRELAVVALAEESFIDVMSAATRFGGDTGNSASATTASSRTCEFACC